MVDGTTIKASQFWDDDTKQMISVNLTVRDIIFFRLLERIAAQLQRGNKK